MIIPYKTTGFKPAIKAGVMKVTWPELVWAAVSYGKSSGCYYLKHPGQSRAEKKYRAYLLYTCLKQKGVDLVKSDLYEEMDSTEKGAASYFLGMMLTKLFADRHLDTPYLWHVSTSSQAISFAPGKSRPDLIGCSSMLGDWIVAEAKGRSGDFDGDALWKAKEQTRMITTINGKQPKTRFGAVSYFSPNLRIRVEDPPEKEGAVPARFKSGDALAEYYSIFEFLKSHGKSRNFAGASYLTTFDEDTGVTIGLPEGLDLSKLTEPKNDQTKRAFPDIQKSDLEYLGSDGFLIRLDERWSEVSMRKEPGLRYG